MSAPTRRCARCVLPESFPGIRFDDQGVCSFCRAQPTAEERKARMQKVVDNIRGLLAREGARAGPYQVVVAYSGGKDSSYLLWLLTREFNARCLAVTVDNGFLSPATFDNCRRMADGLGVDHLIFRPQFGFMKTVYRESLKGGVHIAATRARASDVCNSCIKLINVLMVKMALRFGCRIVAGGYIGAQAPRDSAMLEMRLSNLSSMSTHSLQTFIDRFGAEARQYYAYDDVAAQAGADDRIYITNPLLAIEYSEEEVLRRIQEFGWTRPADTGAHSSNCLMNDLGIVSHKRRYGFHPYEAELAEQVRAGTMAREEALRRIESVPDAGKLTAILKRIDLGESDLG